MNPLDALLVPPALVKRALDDLHDIAQVVRGVAGREGELTARADALAEQLGAVALAVAPLSGQLAGLEAQLRELKEEMAPIRHLAAVREGIEPLEQSMVAVRDSVDELEPMISDLDKKIRTIEPRLAEMQDAVEPIGDLAEKVPGNRRRRSG